MIKKLIRSIAEATDVAKDIRCEVKNEIGSKLMFSGLFDFRETEHKKVSILIYNLGITLMQYKYLPLKMIVKEWKKL